MAYPTVSSIVCVDIIGGAHTLCISSDRTIYSFGSQRKGEHGQQETTVSIPKQIPNLQNIKTVHSTWDHSVCLTFNGEVYTFGDNSSGQLGIGETDFSYTHVPKLVSLPLVQQISCGECFTVCLSDDGELYSFGRNQEGQLGLGNLANAYIPQKIESLRNVDFVECGGYFVICKTFNGDIYAWGKNDMGQLGVGNMYHYRAPVKVPWPENIIDIKCGLFHTLALTSDQEVFSCGSDTQGQTAKLDNNCEFLTRIDCLSEITRIECGYNHSMCIDVYQNLFVFGNNIYGQLGLGDIDKRLTPVKHPILSNVIDVSRGGFHSFVKTSNNEIFSMGYNKYSQLGAQTELTNQPTPLQVFQNKEDIWCSNITKSKAKSARK